MQMKTKKGLLALMTITGASIALVGCSSTEETSDTNTAKEVATKDLTTYTSEIDEIQFQYPSSWETYEESRHVSIPEAGGLVYTIDPLFPKDFDFTTANVQKQLVADDFIVEFIQEPGELKDDETIIHDFIMKITEDSPFYAYYAVVENTDGRTVTFIYESANDDYFEDVKELVKSVKFLDKVTE